MALKASFKTTNRAGDTVTVYGERSDSDAGTEQVRVWTKHANYGFYNLDRFPGGVFTAKTFREFMTGGN